MVYINDFLCDSDSESIKKALLNKGEDGIVIFEKRKSSKDNRDFWLIDEAIVLSKDTTVVIRNCKIKLSDKCRDNFFRSENCGFNIKFPESISNIHILGEGFALLEGADHPRSTGDATKILETVCPYNDEDILKYASWISDKTRETKEVSFRDKHTHTYGTDSNDPSQIQHGDWRNVGILFANLDNFSIKNIFLKNYHGWGISLEACSNGIIDKIDFNAKMCKMIDGLNINIENQDGIDIRNGCHNIVVSNISGMTGDDVVALTAIKDGFHLGGDFSSTHVMHEDWEKRESDIHDIIIRNIHATSSLCFVVRLLACECKIYNVIIDGIIDNDIDLKHSATVLVGDGDWFGKNLPDCISSISMSNIISMAKNSSITIQGYLSNSVISNVVNSNKNVKAIKITRNDSLNNVEFNNIVD